MTLVLLSSLQFKFAQFYTQVMKNSTKLKKMLNIFCIVYNQTIVEKNKLRNIFDEYMFYMYSLDNYSR